MLPLSCYYATIRYAAAHTLYYCCCCCADYAFCRAAMALFMPRMSHAMLYALCCTATAPHMRLMMALMMSYDTAPAYIYNIHMIYALLKLLCRRALRARRVMLFFRFASTLLRYMSVVDAFAFADCASLSNDNTPYASATLFTISLRRLMLRMHVTP